MLFIIPMMQCCFFSVGDIIMLYNKQGSDWWEGELHGRKGLVPATYVEEL